MLENNARLQETMDDEAQLMELQSLLELQRKERKDVELQFTRLERKFVNDTNSNLRSQVFILKNSVLRKKQDILETNGKIKLLEKKVDSTWESVMLGDKKRKRRQKSDEADLPLQKALRQYRAYIKLLFRKHTLQEKIKKKFQGNWKKNFEELQEQVVVKIQRAYRERLRLRKYHAEHAEEEARAHELAQKEKVI